MGLAWLTETFFLRFEASSDESLLILPVPGCEKHLIALLFPTFDFLYINVGFGSVAGSKLFTERLNLSMTEYFSTTLALY